MQTDIVIIGGGIVGSSIAYFLARTGRVGDIVIIEPDAAYGRAASSVGAGGVRQLFSQPENIEMSQVSLDFYKSFAETMGVDIEFSQCGYLFLVGDDGAAQLKANHQRQSDLGVDAHLLSRSELASRFPSLGLNGVALGCFSPSDGTLDTMLALNGFRAEAQRLGVTYVADRVVSLAQENKAVRSAQLASGGEISAEIFINAAGAWAAEIAAMIDMPLPIVPMCRVKHYWESPVKLEPTPLIKDESGVFFRQRGNGYVGGRPSWEIQPGFIFRDSRQQLAEYFDGYFERVVRPLLANVIPMFESVSSSKRWVGHYAQNTLDGNMILGNSAEHAANFYVACGFSGHGVMHAPAVGMALTELILEGHTSTIDLAKMSYQRVLENKPYREQGII